MFNPIGDKIKGFDFNQFLDIDIARTQSSLADDLGIPTLNRFVCIFNKPLNYKKFKMHHWLELQVLDVDCPDFTLQEGQTIELNGAKRYAFLGRNDADLAITFLDTPDLLIRSYFYIWLQQAAAVSEGGGVSRKYLTSYASPSVQIFPLDFEGGARMCDSFEYVFPYSISNIQYDYAKNNSPLKVVVKFKYLYHHIRQVHGDGNFYEDVESSLEE